MKTIIESLNVLRVTNRRARTLLERIVHQGLTNGSGRRPLRGFNVIEIKKPFGNDYFVGLKLTELEFNELKYSPDCDYQDDYGK